MSCKLSDKCDNIFACNVLRPNVELLGCNFYKPKKPQTNEEWFCQLPTGEKADFLANLYPKSAGEALIKISNGDKERWGEWLKQPHTTEG